LKKILILYHSQEYGNTKQMAEAIAEGVEQFGGSATLFNTNDERFDIEILRPFDAAAFGSPDYYSYIAGGLKVFIDDLYIARKTNREGLQNKPYGLFYSHGGGGRVRDYFEKLFSALNFGPKIGSTIESVGAPNDTILQVCREMGRDLVHAVDK
jgi:flavorubredoxin